jgi:hypothetical protein
MIGARVETSLGGGKEKAVTFSRDVAPFFFSRCVDCHRPRQAASMSLLTYKEARPWARAIEENVVRRNECKITLLIVHSRIARAFHRNEA